jgi:hypothetical protein
MKFNPNQFRPPPQGQLLNTQPQNPDEHFSGPASPVSAWAPLRMANGSIRLCFAEQVFAGQKIHFRAAVEMTPEVFKQFLKSLIEFDDVINPKNAIKEVPHVGNA